MSILTEFNEKLFADAMREEGRIESRIESMLDLLADYGEVPEILRKLIMKQDDLEIVRKWHKIAAKAESIENFEQEIGLGNLNSELK